MLCLQGDSVLKQYEIAEHMFFVVKGIVEVYASDNQTVLSVLGEGAFFGEIGILVTGARTCSVKAKTSCLFYIIDKKDFVPIL